MTSSQQSFTTDDMTALVNAFDWGRDNFVQTRTNVNKEVTNVVENWRGDASRAYAVAMQVFDEKLGKMITDCEEIINKLVQSGATYSEQVRTNSAAASTLQQAMEA